MRRILVLFGFLALAVNIASAAVSVRRELPYTLDVLDKAGSKNDVQRDFLFGLGTALAVPMGVLAVLAVAIVLASFTKGGGRFGSLLLALVAALIMTAVLLEPYARTRLERGNLDGVESSLVIANISLCGLVVLLGLAVAAMTPHDRYR